MDPDSERLKDLMLEPRRSLWPRILGMLLLLGAGLGAGYWFYLHPDQLNFDSLKARAKSVMNTPIMTTPAPPPSVDEEPLIPAKKDKPH